MKQTTEIIVADAGVSAYDITLNGKTEQLDHWNLAGKLVDRGLSAKSAQAVIDKIQEEKGLARGESFSMDVEWTNP